MRISTLSLALAALIAASASAFAQSDSSIANKATQPAALMEALESKPRVRVIVELADPRRGGDATSLANRDAIADLQSAVLTAALRNIGALSENGNSEYGLRRMSSIPVFAITVDKAELGRLAADPRVRSIGIDGQFVPHLTQSTALIGMKQAWQRGALGQGRSVAILDTGVNLTHSFLNGTRIVYQACFSGGGTGLISVCPNGANTQIGGNAGRDCAVSGCEHGTHVAGIAAGSNTDLDSGEPKRGVAPKSKIVAVQVFSTNSLGQLPASFSDVIAALDHLFTQRSNITPPLAAINMSIGTAATGAGNCNTLIPGLKTVIDQLLSANIATVISSGNGSDTDGISAPGCISSAVTVGASTKKASGQPERIAFYSNMSTLVDLLAPGGDQFYPSGTPFDPTILSSVPGDAYAGFQGTSMAAPHVAGVFAAVRDATGCGNKTVAQILTALQSTGKLINDQRVGGSVARRRVNVPAALTNLGCATTISSVRLSSAGSWMREPAL